jgi:hypothetical protein
MPPELQLLIEGLALRRPPSTIATVHRQAAEVAREQGWPVPGYLSELAALAVEDFAGQPVPGFLEGELPVHDQLGSFRRRGRRKRAGAGVLAIRPYSANARPSAVGWPSRRACAAGHRRGPGW